MIKRNILSFAALGIFAVFAAGSTPDIMEQVQQAANQGGGGGGGNVAACQSYVDHYNGLSCLKDVQLNAEDMCPPELDISPIDMTGYYQCLQDGAKCNGSIPDLSGAANCSM